MSILYSQNQRDDDEEERDEGGGGSEVAAWVSKAIGMVLGAILLLPFMVIAWLGFKILLQKLRLRPSVILCITLLTGLLSFGVWKAFDFSTRVSDAIHLNYSSFSDGAIDLIPVLISIYIPLGLVMTTISAIDIGYRFKKYPHMTDYDDSWSYNFEFRRTPVEYFRRKKIISDLKAGKLDTPTKAPLGIEDKTDRPVFRTNEEAVNQTLIVGANGSGKSITLESILYHHIKNGDPSMLVTFKDDPKMNRRAISFANEHNCDIYHVYGGPAKDYPFKKLNPRGQSYFNPLGEDPREIPEFVMGMREYDSSSAVYESAMRNMITSVSNGLLYADRSKTRNINWNQGLFRTLMSVFEGDNMGELVVACEGTAAEHSMNSFFIQYEQRNSIAKSQARELSEQLRGMADSSWGEWLYKPKDPQKELVLYEAVKKGKNPPLIIFSFDGDKSQDFASQMGSLIFRHIGNMSAYRRAGEENSVVGILVDEFQSVPPSSVSELLSKGRSSGLAIALSAQNLSQIELAAEGNGNAVVNSMLDNCANYIIHNGSSEAAARKFSGLVGPKDVTVYRSTARMDSFLFSFNFIRRRQNLVNKDVKEVPRIRYGEFMNLQKPDASNNWTCEAIVIKKSPSRSKKRKKPSDNSVAYAKKVQLIPNQKILEEVNEDDLVLPAESHEVKDYDKLNDVEEPVVVETKKMPTTTKPIAPSKTSSKPRIKSQQQSKPQPQRKPKAHITEDVDTATITTVDDEELEESEDTEFVFEENESTDEGLSDEEERRKRELIRKNIERAKIKARAQDREANRAMKINNPFDSDNGKALTLKEIKEKSDRAKKQSDDSDGITMPTLPESFK